MNMVYIQGTYRYKIYNPRLKKLEKFDGVTFKAKEGNALSMLARVLLEIDNGVKVTFKDLETVRRWIRLNRIRYKKIETVIPGRISGQTI